MVGEPSNLELIYATRDISSRRWALTSISPMSGFLAVRRSGKSWKGKAAHSSTPDLGENALVKGLTDIFKRGYGVISMEAGTDSNRIPDVCKAEMIQQQTPATRSLFDFFRALDEVGRDLKKRRDTRFSPAYSTLSLNRALMVEGELQLTFDVRILPDLDAEKLKQKLVRLAESHSFRIIDISYDQPLRGSRNSRFIQAASRALKACGVDVVKKTKASSTEAALYNHFGAEAIVFGPGLSIGNVHRPNEYNSLSQMETATQFYTNLLKVPSGEL